MHFHYATLPMWNKTRNQDHQLIMKQNTSGAKWMLSSGIPRTTAVHGAAGAVASTVRDGPRGRSALRGRAPVHFQACLYCHAYVPKTRPRSLGCEKCKLVDGSFVGSISSPGFEPPPWDWGRVHYQLHQAFYVLL